ncbi:hypothetical protein [Aliiroseovarius sp. F20344]|uniref:hypothetical protein n=1 Tax=Aliiroseovarius sp. F20344 TaxID=2926414 RepID=UPI001FF63F44|nr:hypothetical protein [Aliiroseovarius sp. F20344]MCK0141574.1 hypothetical protein [Aliiroseovarius sp. F20344]
MDQDSHRTAKAEQRLLDLCTKMLSGECSYIQGSRQIVDLCLRAGMAPNDPDRSTFVVIESETDDIPDEGVVKLWSVEAIKAKSEEWTETEVWAKKTGEQAAMNLQKRLFRQ